MAEKEYIERGVALRAIGYMSIEPSKEPDIIELTLLTAQKVLKKIPAADVIEVVRCEDCKFLMPSRLTTRHSCKWHQSSVKFDDFCSYGERKEE